MEEIWYANATCHADNDKQVNVETGSRIPIMVNVRFPKPEVVIT